ncbi:MAG TPA: DJ-1/PfpI family protein [Gemmatimonadaceae bacterium]|nr:DJ-1/PfpI family protein [Gemmatimonadaceae bacterium]
MAGKIYVLVFEGFADWEPSFALAELRRSGGHEVVTIGFSREPVTSMGGLRILPDHALSEVQVEDVRMLILPGGDLWERDDAYPRAELEALLARLLAARHPIAAICGATVALARAGLLDVRRHTSNMPAYLTETVPSYLGQALYEPALVVRDRGIITASGLGAVDFAREIFAELELFSAADATTWFDMFKHGKLPAAATDAR